MDVSVSGGSPKWMGNPMDMDDLGMPPFQISGTSIYTSAPTTPAMPVPGDVEMRCLRHLWQSQPGALDQGR